MKIAVYAISKNEEQFVKRFCESAKDAIADPSITIEQAWELLGKAPLTKD